MAMGGVLEKAAGALGVAESTAKPATTTAIKPSTSKAVSTICTRADAFTPKILMAVRANTMVKAQ